MISDPTFSAADALGRPSFPAPGHNRLYARLTLVIRDSVIDHVFHPIAIPQKYPSWMWGPKSNSITTNAIPLVGVSHRPMVKTTPS